MPPRGYERGTGGFYLSPWQRTTNTHTHTQVGGCVLLFCLLLLFPKLSVPAVLIVQIICGRLSARVSTWHSFVDTFAGREGCPPHARVYRWAKCLGAGPSLSGEHLSFRALSAAEGWGALAGRHRSSLCREKLAMKLKLPSKARADTVT